MKAATAQRGRRQGNPHLSHICGISYGDLFRPGQRNKGANGGFEVLVRDSCDYALTAEKKKKVSFRL